MATFNDAESIRTYKTNFGIGSLSMHGYSDPALRSVAELVLETFSMEFIGAGGGTLEGIDIHHMDAITALKMSLLEEWGKTPANIYLKEPIVNADGVIEFVEIGKDTADLSDIYYEVQSKVYVNKDTHVMITGRKPLPTRTFAGWTNIIGPVNGAKIWDTEAMVDTCFIANFKRYATITFNDPHFSDWTWGDGITSIYEAKDPNEEVIGWAYYLDPGDLVDIDTKISYQNGATVPILIADSPTNLYTADIGALVKREVHPLLGDENIPASCWKDLGSEVEFERTTGIPIEIDNQVRRFDTVRGTKVDKFTQVSKVYVIGLFIDSLQSYPISHSAASEYVNFSSPDNVNVWVTINNTDDIVHELSQQTHYLIGQVDIGLNTPDQLRVVFADNSGYFDFAHYGVGTTYRVDPHCKYFAEGGTGDLVGTILPLENNTGLLVKQVYAAVSLDTPSIVISDPQGNANEIALDLQFKAAAITMYNEPAPIAYNGELIDQTDGYKDNDPTTVQDLTNTEMERVLTLMDGGGVVMKFNMATLTETETIALSQKTYDYIEADEGIETNYVCGPGTKVKLGELGLAGGIINNITYSYSDGGSYTISVSEGPRIMGGLSGIIPERYIKKEETLTLQGTVIQDAGNHVIYKVRIDGLGVRECINGSPNIIRVGDIVTVTIYNNPVET